MSEALAMRDVALAHQRKSDERLRIAAEAAGLGIFEWDPDTDAAVWENERMFALTGQSRERGALEDQARPRGVWHDASPRLKPELRVEVVPRGDRCIELLPQACSVVRMYGLCDKFARAQIQRVSDAAIRVPVPDCRGARSDMSAPFRAF